MEEEGNQEGCHNPMSNIQSVVVEDVATTQCRFALQRRHLELVREQRDFVVVCRCALFFEAQTMASSGLSGNISVAM